MDVQQFSSMTHVDLFLFLFIIFLFKVLELFWGKAVWIGNINRLITVCFAFLATRKQLFSKKSEIILKLKQAALFWSPCWFPRWFWNANRNFKHHEIWVLSHTLLRKLLSLNCLNSEVHRKWASWKISSKMAKKHFINNLKDKMQILCALTW